MSPTLRPLEPEEAPRLVRCFERCYGGTYPDPTFYDAAELARRLGAGTLRSVVAVDETGEIVGHMALHLRAPGCRVAEAGNTVVDPRARGQRLVVRLSAALIDRCREIGLVGFLHYPTSAHDVMQKLAVRGGGIEAGILLDYVPAETHYRDLEVAVGETRHAVVVVYQPLGEAGPQSVFAPPAFRGLLESVYAKAGLSRRFRDAGASLPAGASRATATRQTVRGLVRVDVSRVGRDLADRVEQLAGDGAGAPVAHVDLPLGDPGTPAALEPLRRLGFFLAAVLPGQADGEAGEEAGRAAGGDVLRLQRPSAPEPANLERRLATPDAREWLAVVRADRMQARARVGDPERPVSAIRRASSA